MRETIRAADMSAGAARQRIEDNADITHNLSSSFGILSQLSDSDSIATYLARPHGPTDPDLADGSGLLLLRVFYSKDNGRREEDLFWHEANSAARLTHKNILRSGKPSRLNGISYHVVENKEGRESLRRLITRGGWLDVELAVAIVYQIASALEHAHQSEVLHLNLEPERILIEPDRTVTVAGFGVEAGADSNWARDLRSRRQSRHYLSPEQAGGGSVDHRSDLYSAGVMLFEMLTDRVPAFSTPPANSRRKHAAPAPHVSVFRPDTPEVLAILLAKLLERNPEHRLQSAGELKGLLHHFIDADPIEVVVEPSCRDIAADAGLCDAEQAYETTDIEHLSAALQSEHGEGESGGKGKDEKGEREVQEIDQLNREPDLHTHEALHVSDADLLEGFAFPDTDGDSVTAGDNGLQSAVDPPATVKETTGFAETPIVRAPFEAPDLCLLSPPDATSEPAAVLEQSRSEILSSTPVKQRVSPRYSVFAVNPKPHASRYVIPLAAAIVVLVSIIAFADVDYLSRLFAGDSSAEGGTEATGNESRATQSPDAVTQEPAQKGSAATGNHAAVPAALIKPDAENAVTRRSPANRRHGSPRVRGQRRRLSNPNPYRLLDQSGSEPGWTRYRR